ncbi:MAG: hypothetical protein JXB32_00730 [Deltaproteobacteria bacterium]|nr:hypothetical protein [Deltaproteobacteria bacterium]
MTERDDIKTDRNAPTPDPGLDERAALAARVEDDPAGDAALDERSRRALGQMRELRAVLHEAGPARVSDGFADRVLARLERGEAPAPVVRLAPRVRSRRASLTILVQAASLVALLFAYGALLAATRVHDVGPRWQESDDSAHHESRRSQALDSAVASPLRLVLDSPSPTGGRGASEWNSRRSASPMSGSNASITRTPFS